jgi:hypothetical protein
MGLFNFLFRRMCYAMFDKVDRDKSGYIEAIEVEVAIYRLYNIINKRLPGWQDPPTRQQIMVCFVAIGAHALMHRVENEREELCLLCHLS